VAVKILPKEMSADAARKQRFEREAKTISGLNHPNICVLHDVGSQDGVDYLVMECVEGETLAKRLEKGPLPLEQVLRYGAQIADALDKAHRAGIVHRDLKPGNIMLAATGVKLLDFGLAKPVEGAVGGLTLSVAAVRSSPVTQEGTIVGTFQYMSPEQVEGKEVDGRSDIFSLGAVLYEMLTGKRAFEGKSQLSVASAILEKEPAAISEIKPLTPPALDHAIRKSLAKAPEERWQSAADLGSELKWVSDAGSQAGATAPISTSSKAKQRLTWTIALVAAFIAAAFAFAYFKKPAPESQVLRSTILPPEGGAFVFGGPNGGADLAPDGRSVAFIARVGKVEQVWVRPLDSFTARALPGTEDATFAFWSPDSRNLGFYAQGKLKRIAVAGGPPQTICDADSNRGGSWGRGDVIIFAKLRGGIQRVAATGGTPQPATSLDASRHEFTHRWPAFLPDGNHFIFMALLGPGYEENVIYVGSLDGKEQKILLHGGSPSAYAMGNILYLAGNVLMARPFDLATLSVTGEPVPIAEGVWFDPIFRKGFFSVSENGALLYELGKGFETHALLVFDRTGKQLSNLGESAANAAPGFSPDGRNLIFDLIDTNTSKIELWMQEISSGNRKRLASDPLNVVSHSASWSPDGTRIAYFSARTGTGAIYVKPVNQVATEEERWIAKEDVYVAVQSWTPDGKFLILTEVPLRSGSIRIAVLSVSGTDGPAPLLEVEHAFLDQGQVSPDGRWIAYRSDETGRGEIYVTSFPKATGKLQVSTAGGGTPRWRHDGKELYYLAPDRKLMAVELRENAGSLRVASTRPLFELLHAGYGHTAGVNQYDVTRDGSRFVVDSVTTDETAAPLHLVMNWNAELKKK
jgi:Tol biopolymer transport system component